MFTFIKKLFTGAFRIIAKIYPKKKYKFLPDDLVKESRIQTLGIPKRFLERYNQTHTTREGEPRIYNIFSLSCDILDQYKWDGLVVVLALTFNMSVPRVKKHLTQAKLMEMSHLLVRKEDTAYCDGTTPNAHYLADIFYYMETRAIHQEMFFTPTRLNLLEVIRAEAHRVLAPPVKWNKQ